MGNRLLQMSGVVVDLVYDVEAVPCAGEEAMVTGFHVMPGGGFNAMVAARRAGMAVSYGGSLGTGPFADIAMNGLQAERIPVLLPRYAATDQGCCCVLVDPAGERTFVASDGAEGRMSREALDRIDFTDFDWTLLSGYALHYTGSRDAILRWLEREDPIPRLVFDPSPVAGFLASGMLGSAMERALWISANESEATVLTGLVDPRDSAAALSEGRPDTGGAVVRSGADGCIVAFGGRCTEIPPHRVQVTDTNSAGDTHVGSFIAKLAETGQPETAALYANIAAAISTTRKGPATAPDGAEVDLALEKQKRGPSRQENRDYVQQGGRT
ncbi:MAG: PfkB family carbohydrate kinase [Rhodobacteraceae bacterium]|nr:PfkB family carbohydrate kinase [Paracoccaceae bacterium]MCY4139763.1 PfkB family carbohydrate kinase [Paracoccaceae bacterium]